MPGKIHKIGTFSDWVGIFNDWRQEVGVDHDQIKNFKFDTLYGAIETDEIHVWLLQRPQEMGDGFRKIPDQRMRDALLNYIVYQGDTEFASVEQQRFLFNTAPNDYDRGQPGPDYDRGNAPRLADVPFAD